MCADVESCSLTPFLRAENVPFPSSGLAFRVLGDSDFMLQLPCCSRGILFVQDGVGAKHLDYYLDEFTFRFNRRKSKKRGKLFYRLVQQAVQVDPISWDEIADTLEI